MSDAKFFSQLKREFAKLPGASSALKVDGKWAIIGYDPDTLKKFISLAARGARRKGFIGSDEQAAQYWMNLIYAHHQQKQQ